MSHGMPDVSVIPKDKSPRKDQKQMFPVCCFSKRKNRTLNPASQVGVPFALTWFSYKTRLDETKQNTTLSLRRSHLFVLERIVPLDKLLLVPPLLQKPTRGLRVLDEDHA